MTERGFAFVDDKGGALACLAASIAASRGVPASAETTAPLRALPAEVATVLAEIGVESLEPVLPFGDLGSASRKSERVALGGATFPGSSAALDVRLYEGPDPTAFGPADLERDALARIARDRIERWLDQR